MAAFTGYIFPDDGEDADYEGAKAFYRPGDPDTSRDAAIETAAHISKARVAAWVWWNLMVDTRAWTCTRKVFEYEFLPSEKVKAEICDTRARRLSDFVPSKPGAKNHKPKVLNLLAPVEGQRWDKAEILTYTEWGLAVRANPLIMIPHWGARIG